MNEVVPTPEELEAAKPGYQRPPVEHQFKPGNPGGPGRPPGSFSIVSLLKKKMVEIPIGQTQEWREQIANIILDEAVAKRKGDIIKLLVEHIDGKPKQDVNVDVNRENVDALTSLLKEMSTKPKDGSDTTSPTTPDAGPEPLPGGSES